MLKISAKIEEDVYEPQQADFAIFDQPHRSLYNKSLEFYHCREAFHDQYSPEFDKSQHMLFRGPMKQATRLVHLAENKIKVTSDKRAKFLSTDHPEWLEVKPNWWGQNKLRFSLFTILLRESSRYKNLKEVESFSEYIQGNPQAFKKFLSGNTALIDENIMGSGWADLMDEDWADLFLVSQKDLGQLRKTNFKGNSPIYRLINLIRDNVDSDMGIDEEALAYLFKRAVIEK